MALALAVVGLAFCLACWRVGTLLALTIQTVVGRKIAVAERLATVEERKVTLDEQARKPKARAEPMPPDLRSRIASFDDDWAREDEERMLFALYAEYDDWEQVRKNLRAIATPTETEHIFAPEFVR